MFKAMDGKCRVGAVVRSVEIADTPPDTKSVIPATPYPFCAKRFMPSLRERVTPCGRCGGMGAFLKSPHKKREARKKSLLKRNGTGRGAVGVLPLKGQASKLYHLAAKRRKVAQVFNVDERPRGKELAVARE